MFSNTQIPLLTCWNGMHQCTCEKQHTYTKYSMHMRNAVALQNTYANSLFLQFAGFDRLKLGMRLCTCQMQHSSNVNAVMRLGTILREVINLIRAF